jgi:hypothetical protein
MGFVFKSELSFSECAVPLLQGEKVLPRTPEVGFSLRYTLKKCFEKSKRL